MDIEVRCTMCNEKMECIINVKKIEKGSKRNFQLLKNVGGVYKCPHCRKKIEVKVK